MANDQTEKIELNVKFNKKITSIYKLNIAQMYHPRKIKSGFRMCLFIYKKMVFL